MIKFIRRFAPSVLAVLFSFGVAAVPLENICKEALSDSIKDNYYLLDNKAAAYEYRARLCKTEAKTLDTFSQTAGSVGFDLTTVVGILGVDLGGNDARGKYESEYKKFCSSTTIIDNSTSKVIASRSNINDTLAKSFAYCTERYLETYAKLNSLGTFIQVTPQPISTGNPPVQSFIVETVAIKPIQTNIVIKNIIPSKDVKCYYGGKQIVPGSKIDMRTFNIECTKPAFADIIVSIDTDAGPSNKAKIPSMRSTMTDLSDNISLLQGKVNSLQQQLSQLKATTNSKFTNLVNYSPDPNKFYTLNYYIRVHNSESQMVTCPAGQYMTGIQIEDNDTGGSCASCLTGIRFQCRAFDTK